MIRTYPRWYTRALFVLMIVAVVVRFIYWHYTHRTWEDALITVLHSENAASGLGLTHLQPPGEPPLHGFTSPLSVLLPLVGDLVHVGWGLPFLKLLSAFAGAIAVWLGARIAWVLEIPPVLTLTVASYLALEYHQVLWGMAGMETQVVTVAYLCSILALLRGTQWQKGLSLGFIMLGRPDAAIWVAIVSGVEIWRARKAGAWSRLVPVVAGLLVLYAPWLIFTTLYYGSPVPHTIVAKGLAGVGHMSLAGLSTIDKGRKLGHTFFDILGSLGPSYDGNGTGNTLLWDHGAFCALMIVSAITGIVSAIRRRHTDALLVFAFPVTYAIYLFFGAPFVFGWYAAPVVAAAVIASVYGLWRIIDALSTTESSRRRIAVWSGAVYIAAFISVLPATMRSDKAVQQYVEDGGRKQLGLYIAKVSFPTDTVASESLGYVGYYSRRVIYDFPGLCSREVVEYLRTHPNGRNIISMMHTLRPTYLVLRPEEYLDSHSVSRYPWIEQDYDLVRIFRVPEEDRAKILHPNKNRDFEFDLFRAKGAPARSF